MLATHMNGQPLPDVYGTPPRLRVENQLGYKMVKWIERLAVVASEREAFHAFSCSATARSGSHEGSGFRSFVVPYAQPGIRHRVVGNSLLPGIMH